MAREYDDGAIRFRLEELAVLAGREIADVLRLGFATEQKPDLSPVTEADRRAEAVILSGLRKSYPDIPCIAEEEMSDGHEAGDPGDVFFLVDPLDGTKEFVTGRPEFTVNIALIRHGEPVVGVVLAPAQHTLYSGLPGTAEMAQVAENGAIAQREVIAVRPRVDPPLVIASRSHRTKETSDYIVACGAKKTMPIGSSLKFCMLARGQADLYPRFGRTMQWDTAAGDAVLRAAGGCTFRADSVGGRLIYGRRDAEGGEWANPWFIAMGGSVPATPVA